MFIRKTFRKMLLLRISSGFAKAFLPLYILEIISGLFRRLTHLTSRDITLWLITFILETFGRHYHLQYTLTLCLSLPRMAIWIKQSSHVWCPWKKLKKLHPKNDLCNNTYIDKILNWGMIIKWLFNYCSDYNNDINNEG